MFPIFFSSTRSQQLVCQFRAGRGKAHLWFQFRAAGLRGQAGRCPSGAGQVSAPLRLNAQWWLLWWCGGGHGGVVINISPGLIPLVHKQRLELLWELSTKVCGPLRATELHSHHTTLGLSGQLLVSHQMRTAGQPMRGLNSKAEGWSNGWHWQRWWQRYEGWSIGEQKGHRALFQIDWEILLNCLKKRGLRIIQHKIIWRD